MTEEWRPKHERGRRGKKGNSEKTKEREKVEIEGEKVVVEEVEDVEEEEVVMKASRTNGRAGLCAGLTIRVLGKRKTAIDSNGLKEQGS